MKRMLLCVMLVSGIHAEVAVADAAEPDHTEFYVATTGNDADPGTLQKPFANLEAARDAIRELKHAGPLEEPVTVWVGSGTYYREQCFELTKEDSGTKETPIVYRACGNERVCLVGGREIPASSFKPVVDGAILERLDEAASGKVLQVDLQAQGISNYGEPHDLKRYMELFCDHKRMRLARWPNQGFAAYGEEVEAESPHVRFRYVDKRSDRWGRAEDIFVNGFWRVDWADEIIPVVGLDTEKREITLERNPGYGFSGGRRFYAFNLLEEIDVPGEWYLDRKRGILYLWPPGDFRNSRVLVSLLQSAFVSMRETSFVTIRGFVMEAGRSTAVGIDRGTRNLIAACTIRNVTGNGVEISGGTRNGVLGCEIHGVGLKGVSLNGGDRRILTPAGNYVENCHIHHFALHKKTYQPAVEIGGVGNRVAHCLIHDAPHQAIAYGGNDHVIEYNEIHHVVQESGDAGVLYAGRDWTFRGNVVRYNFIHHIPSGPGYGTKGVYLDDCCSSTTIFGNVFYKMRESVFIGGGRDNIVENNIFIECDHPVHLDDRGVDWEHFKPDGPMYDPLKRFNHEKPPWSTRYPKLARILDENPQQPLGNTVARNVFYRSNWTDSRKQWQAIFKRNQIDEEHLLISDNYDTKEDPGFVDAERMDFQLTDDSTVHQEVPGFVKIPFGKIGLYQMNSDAR